MVDISDLRRLTKELAEEIEYQEKGPLWKFITLILNNIDSYAAILSKDLEVIWINRSAINHLEHLNIDPESLYGRKCIDMQFCGKNCQTCPMERSQSERTVLIEPFTCMITKQSKKLVCIPLVYNGVSGVIAILGDTLNG